jgi:hypothetical protein
VLKDRPALELLVSGMCRNEFLTRNEAIERLAEGLYLKMEKMDPNGLGPWRSLSAHEREFYRASIEAILLERTLLTLALGDSKDSPTTTL